MVDRYFSAVSVGRMAGSLSSPDLTDMSHPPAYYHTCGMARGWPAPDLCDVSTMALIPQHRLLPLHAEALRARRRVRAWHAPAFASLVYEPTAVLVVAVALLGFAASAVSAQTVINGTGVTITVATGTQLVVQGGAQLNTATVFENDGSVHLLGDWTNNSGGLGFTASSTGNVLLHNTLPQTIQGTATTDFRNLVISGGTKTLLRDAQCGTAAQPDGSLTLNSGTMLLNTRTLSLYNPASAALTDAGGSIRSETADLLSRFEWALGSDLSEHRVPFSDGSNNALPFAFTPSVAFPTNTLLSVATYHTAADNTVHPITANQQVLHMAGVSVADNSPKTADRFWLVDLPNGALNGTLRLSYAPPDDPILGPGPVRAQRWLESGGTWQAPLPSQTQPFLREVVVPNVVFSDAITPTNEHIFALAYDDTPLPVSLLSFEASCKQNIPHLTWRTASEQHSELFVVEYTADGLHWSAIGTLQADGTSNIPTTYVLPVPPINTTDRSLYRLLEQDIDGTIEELAVISATPCAPEELILFPNPATDRVYVRLPIKVDQPLAITLEDVTGRIVSHQVLNSVALAIALDVTHFAPGTYHARITTTDLGWSGSGRFVME